MAHQRISSNFWSRKMADTEKRAATGRRKTLRWAVWHATSQLRRTIARDTTSSRLRTLYCLNASIFGNISSACVKEYLIAAT